MLPEPNFPVRPERFIGRRPQIEAFEEALRYSSVTASVSQPKQTTFQASEVSLSPQSGFTTSCTFPRSPSKKLASTSRSSLEWTMALPVSWRAGFFTKRWVTRSFWPS
jgi:hypothetical protein